MIYGESLIKCRTGGFEKESQGQASEKKIENTKQSRRPLKYAFFSIIF